MTVQVTASSPAKGLFIEHISPVTGRVVSTEPALSLEESRWMAARAAAAFPGWSARSPHERADLLLKVADLLEQRVDAFCDVMAQELGTPRKWAAHNVEFAAELLRGAASYVSDLAQPERLEDHRGLVSLAERIPCGVSLGIAPWNAPLILGVRSVATPLLCGNTALLKGSEFAPRTFRMLGDVFRDAGFPEDVICVFLTRPEDSETIVEALIATQVVRRVNFTGSTRIGRRVAEFCAQNLKRPLLELGGQAAMIVLDDADLDAAAEAALWGGYVNQGQVCMSTERVVVADAIADRLIEKIEAGRRKLTVGDPMDANVDLGPVISLQAAERLSGLIGDAVGKGAVLVGGGDARQSYFEPALVDRVEPDMRLYREEVFGPILSITRVHSDLEAVTVANDSDYGLSAAVFGGDLARAEDIARRIHSGICHINRPTVDDNPHAPFGGVKNSGYGRFGGRWALHEFTELRWTTRADGPDT